MPDDKTFVDRNGKSVFSPRLAMVFTAQAVIHKGSRTATAC
jgi:hypothetical protein